MACITSLINLLYLIKPSWCHWIIFTKENLITLICPFCFNIRLMHTYIHPSIHPSKTESLIEYCKSLNKLHLRSYPNDHPKMLFQ